MILFNVHTHNHADAHSIFNVDISTSNQIPQTPFSIGIHPMNAHLWSPSLEEKMVTWAKESNCYAIGECGLDKNCATEFSVQEKVFVNQIRLAQKIKKPLIVHCVKAYNELIRMLKSEQFNQPVIIHGFRGKKELAQQLLREDFYLSIGAGRQYLLDTIRVIPLDHLWLETDDREENIQDVYADIAHMLEINVETLTSIKNDLKIMWNI